MNLMQLQPTPAPRAVATEAQPLGRAASSFADALQSAEKATPHPSARAQESKPKKAETDKPRDEDASAQTEVVPQDQATDHAEEPAADDTGESDTPEGDVAVISDDASAQQAQAPPPVVDTPDDQVQPVVAVDPAAVTTTEPATTSAIAAAVPTTPLSGQATAAPRPQPVKPQPAGEAKAEAAPATPVAKPPPDESLQAQTVQATEQSPDTAADTDHEASPGVPRVKLDHPATPALTTPPSNADAASVPAPPPSSPHLQTTATTSQPAAQSLPTPEPDSAQDQANVARVVRGMQGALNQQGGSVTLRLTPPELGTVRIELAIMQGTVTAKFHTETDSVRQLLTEQMAQLRAGLERQGLSVERLQVQTQSTMPTFAGSQQHGSDQSMGNPNDGRSRGEYATQQDARRDGQGQQQQDGAPRQRFEQELLNALA